MSRLPVTLINALLLASAAAPAAGQVSCGSMADCGAIVYPQSSARQELTTAGINAVLGGATSVIFRVASGEPLAESLDAFWKGAAGGGLIYVGKRVAVEPFDGAGLLGRQLASAGGSMVRNASAGRGAFERLVLPIGPVRLYTGSGPLRVRLDLPTIIASAVFVGVYDARLDAGASLSSGALIFRGDSPMPGLTGAGATMVWATMPASEGPRLMAHERVHILQYDQAFLSWGDNLDRWALGRAGDRGLLAGVDLGGAVVGLRTGLALALDYRSRPWEKEAYFMAQLAHPIGDGHGH